MIEATASTPFEATLEGASAGLVGTIGVRVTDPGTQATAIARTTAGIAEYPAGSGVYVATIVAPAGAGSYTVLWDTGEPLAPGGVFTEELRVYSGAVPSGPTSGLLATAADVELYLHAQGTVAPGAPINAGLLAKMLAAASDRMIRAVPDRTLVPTGPRVRRFALADGGRRMIRVPDLREVLELRLDDREPLLEDAVGYSLVRRRDEDPALWVRLAAGGWGARELVINGQWGPDAVWPSVQEACVVWVARVFHMRTTRFADNAQSGPDGMVLGYFRNLPPDVKVVLNDLWIPGL